MKRQGTLLLNRGDITSLLDLQDYLRVVEDAFRLYAEGRTLETGLLHVDAVNGEFHIKAGGLKGERTYFALKVNGGFFKNRARFGLPNIQGTIILCDGENGYPLALMDSTAITLGRTGATTGLAARLLARPGAAVAAVCGCGTQGRIQLRAVAHVLPIREAYAWDMEQEVAARFAADMGEELSIDVRVAAAPCPRAEPDDARGRPCGAGRDRGRPQARPQLRRGDRGVRRHGHGAAGCGGRRRGVREGAGEWGRDLLRLLLMTALPS
jgi:ornithine cyclodeaminase/alanine dehydrogenase-like protein (mu-crystallin family)